MKNKIETCLFIISLYLFLIPSAYSVTKEELEEMGSTAVGSTIGSSVGHYVGKYVIPSIVLSSIEDSSHEKDYGIIGGLIQSAQKGHAKSDWVDSVEKYGGPLGFMLGAAIGGFVGYTTGEAIPKSIKKVYSYYFKEVDPKNPPVKPEKLDYFLTAFSGCGALASCIYFYKVLSK